MAKYTIEVDDYSTLIVLALISELFLDAENSRIDELDLKRDLPQVMNWVLFEFDVHTTILIDSGAFDKDHKLWPLVMKSAEDLAALIRAQLEDERSEIPE